MDKPTLSFAREIFTDDLLLEMMPLLKKHWEEIARYKDIPLQVDDFKYSRAEQLGYLRLYSIRNHGGKLVGYGVYFIEYNAHYASSLNAKQDVIFIDKEFRGNGDGERFILWCDDQLKKDGVQLVFHHVKAKKELNFGPMLERLGYEKIDEIYGRRLD